MDQCLGSASKWIFIDKIKVPSYNHSVPQVGDYIEIVKNKFLMHSRKKVGVSEGIYYVKSVTQWLVVCSKYIDDVEIIESFAISDFKSGLCLFSVISNSYEMISKEVKMII